MMKTKMTMKMIFHNLPQFLLQQPQQHKILMKKRKRKTMRTKVKVKRRKRSQ